MKNSISSIPLFPPWCVVHPVEEQCTHLGATIPCVARPVGDDIFGSEVIIGHLLTTGVLIAIGIFNLSYVKFPFEYPDAMKITTGFYAIVTGVFSWLRLYFGISRFLLMGAAGHNLFELAMVMQIAAFNTTESEVKRSFRVIGFYIHGIVVLVVMLPTLLSATIVEQAAGITGDYVLMFVSLRMVLTHANADVRAFYKYPAIAHTVHLLFTILPLVLGNFHAGQLSWYNSFYLETAIYISAPISHLLYAVWSHGFDDKKNQIGDKDKERVIPAEYRVKNLKIYFTIGFICGLVTLLGIPLALGRCPDTPKCTRSTDIVGTSVAVVKPDFERAFEDYADSQQLVAKALAFKGNKGYSIVKDVNKPNTYLFIEHWESKEHLDAWLEEVEQNVFSTPIAVNLMVDGKLQQLAGYSEILPGSCHEDSHGGLTFDIKSSCNKVWSVVSNWSDCTWVIGCSYAVVDPATNVRTLQNVDGSKMEEVLRKLDHNKLELVYEVIGPGTGGIVGNVGHLVIGNTGAAPGCMIRYLFSVPRSPDAMPAGAIYDDFFNNRIPKLQQLFTK